MEVVMNEDLYNVTQVYIKDRDYCKLLLDCKDICNQIYIARNISMNNDSILDSLKKIDALMRENNSYN